MTTVAPDGGNGPGQPFDQPGRNLPNDPTYFPLAVWLENVHDCCPGQMATDKLAALADKGINTLYALTSDSNLNAVEALGMKFRLGGPSDPALAGHEGELADTVENHGPLARPLDNE